MGYLWRNQDESCIWKKNLTSKKEQHKCLLLCCLLTLFSTSIHRVINRLKIYSNLAWLRVIMSYHRFNNLDELLNMDLAAKIGQGILSKDWINRECNCSLPYKVKGKCVYDGKFRSKCLIYKVKFSMCDTIYIGFKKHKLKKEWTVIYPISYVYSIMEKN